MQRSFARSATQVKCDLAGDPHSAKRPYARAIQAATWNRSGRIADYLGLSQRTVETWGNPADPQRGPNQVLAMLMEESIAAGAAPEEALAPLFDLAEHFGFDLSARLPIVTEKELLAQVTPLAANAIKETGEAVALLVSMAQELLAGKVSPQRKAALRKELRDARSAIGQLDVLNEKAGRG